LIYITHKEFLRYSKTETRSETSKSEDRSLAIPVELPSSESDTQTFVETNSKKDIKNYNLLLYVFSVHVGLVDTDSFDYHIIM